MPMHEGRLIFAQLMDFIPKRDIETCLNAVQPKLYHAGFRGKVSRSTLGDANKRRDWRIYADFAQVLIRRARALYARDDFGLALKQTAYALKENKGDIESAGQSRQGVADERAARERASDPSRP